MYINIAETYFDLVVTKKNALQLYNRFEYQTKEDFIYYVLFVSEQLGLNTEEFECVLMGAIKKTMNSTQSSINTLDMYLYCPKTKCFIIITTLPKISPF